ncbi:MAG: deoxyguanosinetriphosphate triphosphohydrolase [bacterium]
MDGARGPYGPSDEQRRVVEPAKRSQAGRGGADVAGTKRSPFARDRARVLHSSAFRRLADKTQVVTPGEGDFPRTRLTHSLEVAQVAREMGAALGCDADVVDTAGLAHDLGHPPFGHNGEAALNALSGPAGGFEGNAQTVRILTRLEPKVDDADGSAAGLNLTRAVLDATTKYPWPRGPGRAKFNVYADDLPAFRWYRGDLSDGRCCLEAQVMDWADDIAYSVHDVEDGVQAGSIVLEHLDADAERVALCDTAAELYCDRPAAVLEPVLDRLLGLGALADLRSFAGTRADLVAAKRATSELTGRLAGAAVLATRERFGSAPLARYAADLVVPEEAAAECALLKAIAARYVMQREGVAQRQAAQRRLLAELVEALLAAGPTALDPALRGAFVDADDEAGRLRAVVDQVAQLTDSGAVARHRHLTRWD